MFKFKNNCTFSAFTLAESSTHGGKCKGRQLNFRKTAFTLAEVLITLGIIGIVAALTIPALMNNIQDAQYKTAYKKAYSVASQAWTKAVNDDLITAKPSWGDGETRVSNFEGFMSEFKVTKKCFDNNAYDCWNKNGDFYWGNIPTATAPAFVDVSGMVWATDANSSNNDVGAELLVDTNGNKKPNQFGLDRFYFIPETIDNQLQGLPTRLNLAIDMINSSDNEGYASDACPSYAKHPCYYTSWITGAK